MPVSNDYDLILIGGGIMSASLGVLLKKADPNLRMVVLERLDKVALESSNAWNNAGTGHAALCELNYMPDDPAGGIPSAKKAIEINQQFQESREFWSTLVQENILSDPESFIHSVPHMTFVTSDKDVDYLSRRYQALKDQPLFSGLEFSTSIDQLRSWVPLIAEGRQSSSFGITRIDQGTDVDYGAVTRQLFAWLIQNGVDVLTSHEVRKIRRSDSGWILGVKTESGQKELTSSKVFVGAGGWALKLLQKAKIEEIKGYGTFPVSGHFLRTTNPELVSRHNAKVYSQAAVGAPPMSVPHLDTRIVDGQRSLLFGPFAGINPKFLKYGSLLDLPLSIRLSNIIPYLSVALKNFSLVIYLIREILKSRKAKLSALREFIPTARDEDWELYEAGQRAQVIKPVSGKGTLQFGTEVIASKDATIAGLLGASPGASVAAHVMLDVVKRLYPEKIDSWLSVFKQLIPSYGMDLNTDASKAALSLSQTAKVLKLKA